MALVTLREVGFHYQSPFQPVFENLSLAIDTAWRTALVGRNGRGKTTLLRLLQGKLEPTVGRVHVHESVSYFPYTPAHTQRDVLEVVREAVAPFVAWERGMQALLERGDEASAERYEQLHEEYQRLGGYAIDGLIEREFAALGMPSGLLARSFDSLSGGERTRALIVALFLRGDSFPLIDEPTDHLDMEGRERLGEYLARQDGYVLVSHDRHFLDLCCDHVVSINRSDVRVNQGSFSEWRAQMELEEEHERHRRERLVGEIRSLETAARRRRGWSALKEKQKRGAYDKGHIGHLAAKQMKRAQASERRKDDKLAEKKGLLKNAEKDRKVRLRSEAASPGLVLSLRDVAVERGGRRILSKLSFDLSRGERLAILGPNGCGKTSLLDVLTGELPLAEGTLFRPGHLRLVRGYQQPLWREGELREHLRAAGIDETLFRTAMGSLGVVGEVFDRPLETFSMGERKKVDLCRSFLEPTHLFLWDEPLNYIDLSSREELEEVVLREEPTMLFVEHDRRFVERVATGVIELS